MYKVTATNFNFVQIDKRPGSPYAGDIADTPLSWSSYLPISSYVIVRHMDIPATVEYTTTTMHRHRDHKIQIPIAQPNCPHKVRDLKKHAVLALCPETPSTRSSQAWT